MPEQGSYTRTLVWGALGASCGLLIVFLATVVPGLLVMGCALAGILYGGTR